MVSSVQIDSWQVKKREKTWRWERNYSGLRTNSAFSATKNNYFDLQTIYSYCVCFTKNTQNLQTRRFANRGSHICTSLYELTKPSVRLILMCDRSVFRTLLHLPGTQGGSSPKKSGVTPRDSALLHPLPRLAVTVPGTGTVCGRAHEA